MTRFAALFIALTLAFSVAYATVDSQLHDETYIMAFGETAPSTDVVFGANFAATMKANEGVSFVGTTDEMLEDTLDGDYGSRVVIWIDGEAEEARIYVDDSSKRKSVANAAEDYLEDEGYDVERVEADNDDSGSSGSSKPTTPVKPVVVAVPGVMNNTSVIVQVEDTTPPVAVPITVIAPAENPVEPPTPGEPPSGMSKFWNWFKSLFG